MIASELLYSRYLFVIQKYHIPVYRSTKNTFLTNMNYCPQRQLSQSRSLLKDQSTICILNIDRNAGIVYYDFDS